MSLGSRLRAARAAAGLSLRELSDKVPVSHTAIANYEKDADVPSSAVLIALADATGVDMGFLFRASDVALGAPAWRKRKALSKTEERSILAKTQDVLERYFEVEELLGGEAGGFAVEPPLSRVTSIEGAERAAEELRVGWQLGLDPIDDVTELLEAHGIRIVYIAASEAFDGCTLLANGSIPVIVINSSFPGDRRRLSLVHELAHLVLDLSGDVDPERAAQRFAGAFLFPDQMVRQELGDRRSNLDIYELHLLKHKWGLSMQGIVFRAQQTGVISESRAKGLFFLFGKKGWKRTEPGDPYPREESLRFQRLVMKALAEDTVSRSKASELLGMSFAEFQRSVTETHGADLVSLCD
jgi:Zn-dependent peptidase ImmA (M78 family)/transcriptional regulator with XRE-family HTH domain